MSNIISNRQYDVFILRLCSPQKVHTDYCPNWINFLFSKQHMKGLLFEHLFRDNYIPKKYIVYNQRSGMTYYQYYLEEASSKMIENWECSIKCRLWKTYHFKTSRSGYTFMTFEVIIRSFVCISTTKTLNLCLHCRRMSTSTHKLVFPFLLCSWLLSELTSESSSFSLFEIKSFLGCNALSVHLN